MLKVLENAKKLAKCTTLIADNDSCVVLKVKNGHESDLIELGVFNGDETMLRLTKGKTLTCTIFRSGSKPFSWQWGYGGHTLVTKETEELGRTIQLCIERVYGIKCELY